MTKAVTTLSTGWSRVLWVCAALFFAQKAEAKLATASGSYQFKGWDAPASHFYTSAPDTAGWYTDRRTGAKSAHGLKNSDLPNSTTRNALMARLVTLLGAAGFLTGNAPQNKLAD